MVVLKKKNDQIVKKLHNFVMGRCNIAFSISCYETMSLNCVEKGFIVKLGDYKAHL
jgi:hypothetical protein